MKKHLFTAVGIACLVLLVTAGCSFLGGSDNGDETDKGFVRITGGPTWGNDTINFTLTIQYMPTGEETDLEYVVYDGETLIESGSAFTDQGDGGLNHIFTTSLIQVRIPQSVYGGKEILIWADPDNKKTESSYATDEAVDLWKKEYMTIPEE